MHSFTHMFLVGIFGNTILLWTFTKCVKAAQCNATFDVYAGLSVNSVTLVTEARTARECSKRCSSMKCENSSCQLATFRRDTSECFLSNGTVWDVGDIGNGNYKTMVVQRSMAGGSYSGTEFYTGFMANYDSTASLELLFVSAVPTRVNVEIPYLSSFESFDLNESEVRSYSYGLAHTGDYEQATKGIYISATQPITVYQSNNRYGSIDMSLVLPTTGTGKNYIIQTTPNGVNNNMFLIVSTKNANFISVVTNVSATTLTLNRLETYFRLTPNLAGTVITATEDVVVQSGAPCTCIPAGTGFCDNAYESLPPESSYGQLFVLSFMYPRPDFTLGILAKVTQTTVTIADVNGAIIETLYMTRAEPVFREYIGGQTILVSSTQGILVTQYGRYYDSTLPFGDPSLMLVAPLSKLGTVYDILLPSKDMNVIEVIVDDETQIRLNGSPATFLHSLTVNVPSVGPIRVAYVSVVEGRYRISHLNAVPFAVYVYGGGEKREYAMCAGWLK